LDDGAGPGARGLRLLAGDARQGGGKARTVPDGEAGMNLLDSLPATISLSEVAHGRSGDKGNHANVAVIAYTPDGYAWLRQRLTAERVREYFAPLKPSKVERFDAPNLLALNFLLHNVLAGGASRSLRADTQGKT